MKLLFDHNLAPRLVNRLADLYFDASHVLLLGLDHASDLSVWYYAGAHDFMIVTKDSDFNDLSMLRGFPPKVIWFRLGNCTTADVEHTLRAGYAIIEAFYHDPALGVLQLF